jgi:hypothetical protein
MTPAMRRRAAKADALGLSNKEIARRAGKTGRRAEGGVDVAEWRRNPEYRELVKKYAEEAMSGEEWEARNASIARYELPSRIETDGKGKILRMIHDVDAALHRQGKALGKLKDRHIHEGPDGGPVKAQVTLYRIPSNGREKTE